MPWKVVTIHCHVTRLCPILQYACTTKLNANTVHASGMSNHENMPVCIKQLMSNLTVYPQIGHGLNYLQSLANLSKTSTAALLRLLQSRSQNHASYTLLQGYNYLYNVPWICMHLSMPAAVFSPVTVPDVNECPEDPAT